MRKVLSRVEVEAICNDDRPDDVPRWKAQWASDILRLSASHEALWGMLVEAAALLSVRVRNDEYGYCYFCEQHNDPHTNACEYTGWLAKMREAGIVEGD